MTTEIFDQDAPTEIEVRHEVLTTMPKDLAVLLCKQMKRWLGVEATPKDLTKTNLRIKVDDRTPPEWMLLFEALRAGHWSSVEIALENLRKVRADVIKKRSVTAKLHFPS